MITFLSPYYIFMISIISAPMLRPPFTFLLFSGSRLLVLSSPSVRLDNDTSNTHMLICNDDKLYPESQQILHQHFGAAFMFALQVRKSTLRSNTNNRHVNSIICPKYVIHEY